MARDQGWRAITNDREKYAAYLCSREWGILRERVSERADGKCELCLVGPLEAVHHLTYERKYNERIEDLQGICNRCHKFTHGRSDEDPREYIYPVRMYDNTEFPSLGAMICPMCNGHMTNVGNWRNEPLNGHPAYRLTAVCHTKPGWHHLWDIVLLNHGSVTAITTCNFSKIAVESE